MKIKISDDARKAGWTNEHMETVKASLAKFGDRFVVTELSATTNNWHAELCLQVTGTTPNHGPQQAETRISSEVLSLANLGDQFGAALYDCIDRDLSWIEGGRCLGMPSTKQLAAAREFLGEHLREIEAAWLEANERPATVEATPVPLHMHLWNVIAGLIPSQVEDPHRERATELVDSITGEKTCLASLSGKTEHDPNVGAYNVASLHAAVAQAIANAEARGEQKGREAATA